MKHQKLDAALSNALTASPDRGDALTVFISFEHPLSPADVIHLRGYGVLAAEPDRKIVTATLPRRTIDVLSEYPLVRSIRLCGTSTMLSTV